MKILSLCSLDTQTELALLEDDRCLDLVSFPMSTRLSEELWERLSQMLDRQGWTLRDIDAFSAIRGPGTYTALRVGLAALDGFAWSLDRPIVGFTRDEVEGATADSSEPLVVRCAQLAIFHIHSRRLATYECPVLPDYGAAFQPGPRA